MTLTLCHTCAMMALTPNPYPKEFKDWVRTKATKNNLQTEDLFKLLDKPEPNPNEKQTLDIWKGKWDDIKNKKTKKEKRQLLNRIDFESMPYLKINRNEFQRGFFSSKEFAHLWHLITPAFVNLPDKLRITKAYENFLSNQERNKRPDTQLTQIKRPETSGEPIHDRHPS